MDNILSRAQQNQTKAYQIIENLKLIEKWEAIGATVNLVGSLKMGLLVNRKDIDFHIYTPTLDIESSFSVMCQIALTSGIKQIQYTNLSNTEEQCLEWHAWYEDTDFELWQIDIIQMLKGSKYDGFFENVADRILAVMTAEQKSTILKLKNQTPKIEKIAGVEYYQAVIQYNIQDYAEFQDWRLKNTNLGINEWCP